MPLCSDKIGYRIILAIEFCLEKEKTFLFPFVN